MSKKWAMIIATLAMWSMSVTVILAQDNVGMQETIDQALEGVDEMRGAGRMERSETLSGDLQAAAIEQNGFLNIGDGAIKGNATVNGYEDQIVVQSVSYGVSQAGEWEEGEQITGRVTTFGEMSINKVQGNSSPLLFHASAMKTQFDKAELNLVAGTDAYLTVTLEKVIITNVQAGWSSGDTRPTENFTMSYRKATWRYGTNTRSYDLASATD